MCRGDAQLPNLFRDRWSCAHQVVKRHVPNIKRLIAGTELRFGTPKPAPEVPPDSEPPPTMPTHGAN